jgi:transcriptional regulatory protein RtcR
VGQYVSTNVEPAGIESGSARRPNDRLARDSPEDIEPNLDFELERLGDDLKQRLTLSREARDRYLTFARSAAALWSGNFRDFGASLRRMATLCAGGRISVAEVDDEVQRLRGQWQAETHSDSGAVSDGLLERLFDRTRLAAIDRFDRVQLEEVVGVCRTSRSLSEAGRTLFAASRAARASTNDADRVRKYLARYGLTLQAIQSV